MGIRDIEYGRRLLKSVREIMASINQLQEIAVSIREKFKAYELAEGCGPWSRKDLMLGFIADVGALAKLSMAADGMRNIPHHSEKLGHEMADCFWSLLVLAKEYEIDLEREFLKLTEELTIKLQAGKS